MNGRLIKVWVVLAGALGVSFVAQQALAEHSNGMMLSAVVTLAVLLAAGGGIWVVLRGDGDSVLLRLLAAATEETELDGDMVRAAGPLGEAVHRVHQVSLERSHWYESILNTLPFGISVTDMDMHWTFCNTAALKSMDKQASDCMGRHCSEKGGNLCNTPGCGIEQLRRGNTHLMNTLPTGRTMRLNLHYMLDRSGKRVGHVEISQDVTEEVVLKREAREAAQRGRQEIVQRLSSAGEKLKDVASTLMNQIGQVKEQTIQAASRLGETSAAMEEMNSTVLEVARNAEDAARASMTVQNEAEAGTHAMEKTVHDMRAVQEHSMSLNDDMLTLDTQARGIGEILTIIRDIADQTNLLALNAAIEAARAGDAGRGFAVVADEVRKLAEKTMTATHKVDEAIGAIQTGTDKSAQTVQGAVEAIDAVTRQAQQSGEALARITGLANDSSSRVQAIATAATEQSAASEEINRNVADISNLGNSISLSMEAATKEVEEMLRQAQNIHGVLEKISNETESDAAQEQDLAI